jgi:hypothetical protein
VDEPNGRGLFDRDIRAEPRRLDLLGRGVVLRSFRLHIDDDLHVVRREDAAQRLLSLDFDLALEPVGVQLAEQADGLALAEGQLARVFRTATTGH